MSKKELCVFADDTKREGFAQQQMAGAAEKFGGGEIAFLDATDSVETDISERREIEKIDISLNGRFQLRLRMFEDRRNRRMNQHSVFAYRPVRAVGRKSPRCAGSSLRFFHVRPN